MARFLRVMSRAVVVDVVVDVFIVVAKLGAKAAVVTAKEKITISTKSSNKACFFMV